MSAVVTSSSYDAQVVAPSRRGQLRQMIAGAAVFDGVMGIFTIAAAHQIGGWLSLGSGSVRAAGGIFVAAAIIGAETLLRRRFDVRWIVGANAVFAAWCLALLGIDSPNAVGAGLLIVSAVASGGTAVGEQVLSGR